MENWQKTLQQSVTTIDELPLKLRPEQTSSALEKVIANFPMRINPYFLNLIEEKGDPLWKQAIPDIREGDDSVCLIDPLKEEKHSPVPNLVHKYPDRVLLLVASQCAMYCRFCTRKRKVGSNNMHITESNFNAACSYLRSHPEIREVLLSGGDPLLLSDAKLDEILFQLRQIPNIEIIRIGSRIPSTLPMRITEELVQILKKHHPLYLNTQFNHPNELSVEAAQACTILADNGIPLGCQTVLLNGINDSPHIIENLMRKLLKFRIKPYYLFQGDLTLGTDHFRTPVKTGIEIMRHLYKNLSGMGIPTFALDAPDGTGKIPLTPNYIKKITDTELIFTNLQGNLTNYPQSREKK